MGRGYAPVRHRPVELVCAGLVRTEQVIGLRYVHAHVQPLAVARVQTLGQGGAVEVVDLAGEGFDACVAVGAYRGDVVGAGLMRDGDRALRRIANQYREVERATGAAGQMWLFDHSLQSPLWQRARLSIAVENNPLPARDRG